MSDNIKVVVKIRPLISREIEDKLPCQWRVQNNTLYQLDSNGRDAGQTFTFDKVYDETTKTTDVYNDVAKPIVEAATAGFNGTIFAYGQTSSGKTYTMTGTDASPGIIPLSILNLFKIIKNIPDRDFLVRVSYIEIYNDSVKDLLDIKRENIKIHETYERNIKVDVTERVTSSPEDVLEAMREGDSNRQTGATNMNEKSSRSHSIFQITIESREHFEDAEQAGSVNVSQLNLVDLAGSERAGQTGATGKRFKEGTHINKSLSTLGLVIKTLSEDPNKYVNYRDSKLTRILQNSLGGNAKTSIICAITPTALEETISTLQFADRAKAIKNKPEVNAVATDATMIQSLTKQLSKLQSQLESKKNLEVMLENKKNVEQDLQRRIDKLRKLIINGFCEQGIQNIEGTRRKLQPPRRMTISTLHSIEEHPAPTITRFCTPSLKYNSMLIQNPSEEFVPSSSMKLPSLPEELPRDVTPPPNDKKVNFNDEVIEIDSEDDENSTIPTCSPYHKCYSVSKTPPCVLRKNLSRAEKNYQEIVELTEREKMYTPDVVELMEKLELSRTMTEKLQDEVEILKKSSKEKDLEIEQLISKIKKTEDEVINTKIQLETSCKEYETKLTDWEVSYDVLKKKAALREEELLSVLKEQKNKYGDIGKLPPKAVEKDPIAFMNMSKDIYLVNSNESTVTTSSEDESSQQLQDLVASLQDQLIAKSQTIIQLEANIASQKKSIEFLEQSSHQLQVSADSLKEKNNYLEKENDLYKSTVDTLNKTIISLKEQVQTNQNYMSSNISVIQELQIKLAEKDNLFKINITDSVLENMIANEEKVIANNENVKTIIQSFKIALDKRNKDIEHLKTSIQTFDDSQSKALMDVKDKTKQIEILNEEISKLKEQAQDNIATINNLMCDKTYLVNIEQELTKNLADVESKKTKFEELIKEYTLRIDKLEETNIHLLQCLSERDVKEQEYIQLNNELQNKMYALCEKINEFEEEIKRKELIISTLNKQSEDKQEYEHHAKSALDKLKKVVAILNGDVQETPELIENFVILFKALSSGLSILENVAIDTVSEKSLVIKENTQLKSNILELNHKFETEKAALQHEIENLKKSVNNYLIDMGNIKQTNKELSDKIFEQQKEICAKCDEYNELFSQYKTCKDAENDLRTELLHKQQIIFSFDIKESELKKKIDDLEAKLQNSDFLLKSERDHLQLKVEILAKTLSTIEELKSDLKDKCKEVIMLQEKFDCYTQLKDQNIENIYNKLCDIKRKLNIESNFLCVNGNNSCYEQILLILDQISSQTAQTTNSTHVYHNNNIEQQMLESDIQIENLVVENRELKTKLSQIRDENKVLINDLEKNNIDKKSLYDSLKDSNKVLEQLRNDVECKAAEIEEMEIKANKCKEQFFDLDVLMNRQMQDLRYENETLKARCLELNNEKHNIEISNETHDYDSNLSLTALVPKTKESLNVETVSPPSLLTICCNKIVERLEPKQNYNNSDSSSNSDTEIQNIHRCSTCDQLSLELRILQDEKSSLSTILEQLEIANKELIMEQENIRQEIRLLLEPAQKLQKKISNHKTNLSILTATTYAENKSLKSQVKALQHHHRRLHNVCQGDIPEFRKQLNELFIMLKGNSSESSAIQNTNLKRHSLSDVLDINSTISNFKNESTLNGDLLMLDTNVTLTTTGDNTLVGYDQTCLDLNLTMFNEMSCQTNDAIQFQSNNMHINNIHTNVLENGSRSMFTSLEELRLLKEENSKLKALVDRLTDTSASKFDAQSSPIKLTSFNDDVLCNKCYGKYDIGNNLEKEEINHLTQELSAIKAEKQNIEEKYNNLVLEMPNTDALASKLNAFEKESNIKANEVSKLTDSLNKKNKELRILQEEYDALSTQIMENISEADDLNKELDRIKSENLKLTEKVLEMESRCEINTFECPKCQSKDEGKHHVSNNTSPHTKISRSFSDSDTSSRYNKICTLQSELYAGREDCKVLTEDVASIKQHLDCSNMSMDLDESVSSSDVFSQSKNFVIANTQHIKCMPGIQEEHPSDIYTVDKIDCYNYYLEIAGEEKDLLSNDVKIIDIMKMFYNNMLAKHCNEIQNLTNKLKDYEESRNILQKQIDDMVSEYSTVTKTLKEKENNLTSVSQFISGIKSTMNSIHNDLSGPIDREALTNVVNMFKLKFLSNLDYEFGISSVSVFEFLVNKYQNDLTAFGEQCMAFENEIDNLNTKLCVANSNLEEFKTKLAEKENESNLLKAQKDKIHEISSAVTLDIVRKEQEMRDSLRKVCQKLIDLKILTNLDLSEYTNDNINVMIDRIINEIKLKNYHEIENEKEILSHEVKKSKNILNEKEKELIELKSQIQTLRDMNNNVTLDLNDKEVKLQTLKTEHDELNKAYDCKIQENIKNINEIDKLTEEITSLRETISNKESKILSLTKNDAKSAELLTSIKNLQEDNEKLKSINQMILKEKHSYSIDLEKTSETIKQNNLDMEKMTSDILVLRESVKEATTIIESLKQEVQKLSVINAELKFNFEERNRECLRLEMNIKTHEKTAEIQSRMITRLQKQKEEDDRVIAEIKTKIDEANERYNTLQNECQELRNAKESLKARVAELEEAADKPRLSLDAIADCSRRRRQSMHDSKRLLSDFDEHRNLETMFESRQKSDDLFMDVDGDDISGRSTPFGLGKGRDSLLSRTDQSDKDEEHSSRPSSVLATRRRRQSIHDLHRGVARHTPSPHDLLGKVNDEPHRLRDNSGNRSDTDEVNHLREQLTACQQELDDLKEKYRELDEECETCAEYLRERDEQCLRLKKEKAALEKQVTELKSCNQNSSQHTHLKPSVADVAVNTDEDWANLHAVVVDRMSYDAEVDKNKRLTRIVEELRFQKQDLKNTIAKMQKALEKHQSSKDTRELETTKKELKSVKEELEELKVKYKELDEECETCAEYLKEREEQCRRLKEAKTALESKLQELQEDAHTHAHSHFSRKKRQTIHDMNRISVVDQTDASTATNDDVSQAEHDDRTQKVTEDKLREIKRLKMIVDKLTHQKAALEQQLRTVQASAPQPMYVATGSAIVQNQQLSDVMKENQRLKKINTKLVNICKKRGKSDANRENEVPCEQG